MGRNKMPFSQLSAEYKYKNFTKEEIQEREDNEKAIVELFNDGFEDIYINSLKGLKKPQLVFYKAIEKILKGQGNYMMFDSAKIRTLSVSYFIMNETEKLLLQDPLNTILQSTHKSYQKMCKDLEVELQISISERQKLREMSLDGAFVDSPSQEEIDSAFAQYFGGK